MKSSYVLPCLPCSQEDLCTGLAYVDMVRVAFEQGIDLKQLKANHSYLDFLPRHIAKKVNNPIVKWKFGKNIDSDLEKTYQNFKMVGNNPLRTAVVSYLKQLLPTTPK